MQRILRNAKILICGVFNMFFIYDCNECIVGNHKGYAKYSSAQMIATRMRHKLWERYDDKIAKYKQDNVSPAKWDRLIYSIKQE